MDMKLAENIRALRKARSLTQEQLSEVLGVTPGAVYKWEAGLSLPELGLIVEMADFFDISVDSLLGYEMKDNRLEATVKRLREYRRNKDIEGLSEAEKALKKYPHSFKVVGESATLFRAFGIETGRKEYYLRALELLEKARVLLPQNTDPEISEQTLYGKMAETYLGLDEPDKAIELWKAHNAGGLYNHCIGHILAICERTEEAAPFLSEAMAKGIGDLLDTVTGYLNVFFMRGDFASAEALLSWGLGVFSGLRKDGRPNFLDKVNSGLLAALAFAQFVQGRRDESRESLARAKDLAAFFDASPSYDESDIRFIDRIEGASVHDDIGKTAREAIENVVSGCESEEFSALWRSVAEQGAETNG